MGWLQRMFCGNSSRPAPDTMPDPFMEHRSGEFDSAVAAIEDAVKRLRTLPSWERWITLTAQGQGQTPDAYECVEIRMLGDMVDVGNRALDVLQIAKIARTDPLKLTAAGTNYPIAGASDREAAQILDAIFRHHFGIRPFDDEDDDYAVGAEW